MTNWLDKILNFTIVLMMSVTSITVFMAVIYRYVLNDPLGFSFGLSTFLLCWMLFLALPLAYKHGYHIAMDSILELLPAKIKFLIQLGVNLVIIVILGIMAYYGFKLTAFTGMVLQDLNIPESWLYASLPIGCSLTVLYILEDSIKRIKSIAKL